MRDEYKLRQSILNFQLVRVDQNNFAYLTDCFCHTESIQEIEGKLSSYLSTRLGKMSFFLANERRQLSKSHKSKKIGERTIIN